MHPLIARTTTAFIRAAGYTPTDRHEIDKIVIHTMQNSEKPKTARGVARWFAGLNGTPPKASAHACGDAEEVIQCVDPSNVAWGAPGANSDGYQIELAGYAEQTPEQWGDDYSRHELRLAAEHAAAVAYVYQIPCVQLTAAEMVAGHQAGRRVRGFCGHVDVTHAFHESDHVDPGPAFPWGPLLTMVRAELDRLTAAAAPAAGSAA